MITLVACVGKKLDTPAPARELYQSVWFKKARRFAEGLAQPWFILSAEHGLLDPHAVIAPYDRTLNSMRMWERRDWGYEVSLKLRTVEPALADVIVLAGKRYRVPLCGQIAHDGRRVHVPMRGLGIGEQLRWLNRNTMPDLYELEDHELERRFV